MLMPMTAKCCFCSKQHIGQISNTETYKNKHGNMVHSGKLTAVGIGLSISCPCIRGPSPCSHPTWPTDACTCVCCCSHCNLVDVVFKSSPCSAALAAISCLQCQQCCPVVGSAARYKTISVITAVRINNCCWQSHVIEGANIIGLYAAIAETNCDKMYLNYIFVSRSTAQAVRNTTIGSHCQCLSGDSCSSRALLQATQLFALKSKS